MGHLPRRGPLRLLGGLLQILNTIDNIAGVLKVNKRSWHLERLFLLLHRLRDTLLVSCVRSVVVQREDDVVINCFLSLFFLLFVFIHKFIVFFNSHPIIELYWPGLLLRWAFLKIFDFVLRGLDCFVLRLVEVAHFCHFHFFEFFRETFPKLLVYLIQPDDVQRPFSVSPAEQYVGEFLSVVEIAP